MTKLSFEIISLLDSSDNINYDYLLADFVLQQYPSFFQQNLKYFKKNPKLIVHHFDSLSTSDFCHYTFAYKTPKKGWKESDEQNKKSKLLITLDWLQSNVPDFVNSNIIHDVHDQSSLTIINLEEKVLLQQIELSKQKVEDLEKLLSLHKQLLLKDIKELDYWRQIHKQHPHQLDIEQDDEQDNEQDNEQDIEQDIQQDNEQDIQQDNEQDIEQDIEQEFDDDEQEELEDYEEYLDE